MESILPPELLNLFNSALPWLIAQITGWSVVGGTYLLIRSFIQRKQSKTLIQKSPEEIMDELSPAAVRYLYIEGYDLNCYVSTVLNATAKGAYRVVKGKKGHAAKLVDPDRARTMKPEELKCLRYNRSDFWKMLTLNSGGRQFARLNGDLKRSLENRLGKYFIRFKGVKIAMVILSAASVIFTTTFMGEGLEYAIMLFLAVVLPFFIAPLVGLLYAIKFKHFKAGLISGLVLALFALVSIGFPHLLFMGLTSAVFVFIHYYFWDRINYLNEKGRKLKAAVNSLKEWLTGGGQEDEGMMYSALGTQKEFDDRILPYAYALDVKEEHHEDYADKMLNKQFGGPTNDPDGLGVMGAAWIYWNV